MQDSKRQITGFCNMLQYVAAESQQQQQSYLGTELTSWIDFISDNKITFKKITSEDPLFPKNIDFAFDNKTISIFNNSLMGGSLGPHRLKIPH